MKEINRVVTSISNRSFIEPPLEETLDDGTVKIDYQIPIARLIMSL